MADRLAVHAGSRDLVRGHTRPGDHGDDGLRIHVGEGIRRACGAGDLVGARALQREELGPQRRREGQADGGDKGTELAGELRDNGVDAVEAGAGHHADEALAMHANARSSAVRHSVAASS